MPAQRRNRNSSKLTLEASGVSARRESRVHLLPRRRCVGRSPVNPALRGPSVRRLCALLLVASAGAIAVVGARALADDPDINTIRLEPGPTTPQEQAAVDAAKTRVGADYV